jgi:hypothetical protein
MALAELAELAEPEAVELARQILEHSINSRAWGAQVGPALTQGDTARLLRKSVQAVSKDRGLLRVVNSDGRPVYPLIQFDGRRQVPGLAAVIRTLAAVMEPLAIAGWLTTPNAGLGARPIDALRAGSAGAAAVQAAAARIAARVA